MRTLSFRSPAWVGWLAIGAACLLVSRAATAVPAKRIASPLASAVELGKPISVSETKIPLGELVAKVAADTGAKLTAAPGVADEPVAVLVKDLPARELLEQLADLLDYRWHRLPEHRTPNTQHPSPAFEIYQDLASKQNEEALRQAAYAGAEKRLREEVQAMVTVAALPPAAIERLAEEHRQWEDRFYHLPYAQRLAEVETLGDRMKRPGIAARLVSPVNRNAVNFMSDEPIALYLLLDRLTRDTYRWDHHGSLIRFRYRDWPFARRAEVPLRLLRRWQSALARDGAMSLEEYLLAVTTLDDGQLASADSLLLEHAARNGRPIAPQLSASRHALRLYAALSPAQREALWQGRTVPAAGMTPAQRALFLAPLAELDRQKEASATPAPAIAPDAGFTLKSERLIQVIEPHAGGLTIRSKPAAAAPPTPGGGAPGATGPGGVIRHPITSLTFGFLYSPALQPGVSLQVGSPS